MEGEKAESGISRVNVGRQFGSGQAGGTAQTSLALFSFAIVPIAGGSGTARCSPSRKAHGVRAEFGVGWGGFVLFSPFLLRGRFAVDRFSRPVAVLRG